MTSPEIGQQVAHYRILERLGAGGMGVVYRAEDVRLGREVAVKFLHPDVASDPPASERFRREARALSSLNHPNVCTVHDVGEHGSQHFIVMELIEGESLGDAIGGRALAPGRVLALGIQIAEGLEAAHTKGILHRDVKPANVFVTTRGTPKVLDFGLAKPIPGADSETPARSVSETNAVVGTLPYMAPEQLLGEPIDVRTDVHALGAVLYEMATGVRPYRNAPLPRLTDEILHQAPTSPHELNAAVSPRLETIILKCLAKKPEDRYPSMAAVVADLRAAVEEPAPSPGRRYAAWAVSLGLIVVATVAALVLLDERDVRPPLDSIAVLPLDNLSGDAEQQYFTDGMTEALIANLSKIKSLRVASRTSAMRYRDTGKSVPEIARELGVDAVVEGSVLRSGNRVRITAQLIEAATDRHLWAESYERDLEDVLALQASVARAIAEEVRHTLTFEEASRLDPAPAVNPDAYEAYLKGRYFQNRRTVESLTQGIEYFEQAIRVDPDYAPAWAGLADCELLLSLYPMGEVSPREALPRARAAAIRALELDETLADAHTSLAYERLWSWDFAASEAEFRRAIELDPSYATARFWYAARLAAEGRFEEALAESLKAQALDPVSPILKAGVSWMFHLSRRYDEEVLWARRTLELDPAFLIGSYRLAEGLLHGGDHAYATAEFERALSLSGGKPDVLAALGHARAMAGRRDEAQKTLQDLVTLGERRYVSSYSIAIVHAALGNADDAFRWLEKACEERAQGLAHIAVEVDLDPLRSDPRFERLYDCVGLEPRPENPR